MEQRKQLGKDSEQLACKFLERQGYRLVQRNFHSKWGEIDLIMRKGQELVFVEVRSKSNRDYGQPAETVDKNKQEKIRKTAQLYLYQHQEMKQCYCRFDVIGVVWQNGLAQIEWLADAFQ